MFRFEWKEKDVKSHIQVFDAEDEAMARPCGVQPALPPFVPSLSLSLSLTHTLTLCLLIAWKTLKSDILQFGLREPTQFKLSHVANKKFLIYFHDYNFRH